MQESSTCWNTVQGDKVIRSFPTRREDNSFYLKACRKSGQNSSLRNSLQPKISHNIVDFRDKGWVYLSQHELVAVYFKCLPLPTRSALVLSRWCRIQLLSSMSFTLPDTVKFKKPHPRSDERRCKAYYQVCTDGTASLITSLSFWLASYNTKLKGR